MLEPFLAQFPQDLLHRLNAALEGLTTFLIGGTTRDLTFYSLGLVNLFSPDQNGVFSASVTRKAFRDLDLICYTDIEEILRRMRSQGFKPIPVGRQFEIVKIVENGFDIDISVLAKNNKGSAASEHLDNLLLNNLSNRDLTLNAMAISWPEGVLIDPLGGQNDIRQGVIRAVGDPRKRLSDDPLRLMRIARFSSAYGFTLEDSLPEILTEFAHSLTEVAPERIQAELMEILETPFPSIAFRILQQADALKIILPELADCAKVKQSRLHQLDVFEHSLLTCDLLPSDKPLLRLAGLFHDLGKPGAKRYSEMKGDHIFYGHAHLGAEIAHDRLTRLRFSNDEISYIRTLTHEHMFKNLSQISAKTVRRWLGRLADLEPLDAIRLMAADTQATTLDFRIDQETVELLRILRHTKRHNPPIRIDQLAIGGKDFLELGMKPSPLFSKILYNLLDLVLEDPFKNEKSYLLSEAQLLFKKYRQ